MKRKYGLIIDTNKYSGNFEREMCAFMTGHVGECGVGQKQRDIFLEEFTEVEEVTDEPDDSGYYRPVEIFTTPNVWNNGLGFNYIDGEEEIALIKYKEYVKEDKEKWMEIVESHRGKNLPSWTEEAINRTIKGYKEEIVAATSLTKPNKYPAYQSVLIHFSSPPPVETMEFLKQRAYKYAETFDKDLIVTGFRFHLKTIEEDYKNI